MSVRDSRRELQGALYQIEDRISRVERQLRRSDPRERVRCLGEKGFLMGERDALLRRLREIDGQKDGLWASIRAWFRMEGALVTERMHEWVTRHDHDSAPDRRGGR
jgi:hypothetical protein